MERFKINILTEKDSETDEWVILALEIHPDHDGKDMKKKIELARGRNLEEAYSSAIKKLLNSMSNLSLIWKNIEIDIKRYTEAFTFRD